jgi:4-diphosphocytidyl-2-C-methyl-D-erythritol kinase
MLAAALAGGEWAVIAPKMHNDFEDVVLPEIPIVAELRRAFQTTRALGSLLSGSGSTVFALAATHDDARRVAERAGTFGARIQVVRCAERGVTVAGLV